jgi:hypothetical protein
VCVHILRGIFAHNPGHYADSSALLLDWVNFLPLIRTVSRVIGRANQRALLFERLRLIVSGFMPRHTYLLAYLPAQNYTRKDVAYRVLDGL